MRAESRLFSESPEQIYARVYQTVKPGSTPPTIDLRFRRYANVNNRIRLDGDHLSVDLSDLLQDAPSLIQEALAFILIYKLFRKNPDRKALSLYRRYLNRSDVRSAMQSIKQTRGRKIVLDPRGGCYDLCELFEELNLKYFHGLMARPRLGWSVRPSCTILGHYDPSHHTIVLSKILDSQKVPAIVVNYVMFHEMLHLRFPTQHRGCRRCIHTPEFKAAEKTFEHFRDAQRELKAFVQSSLSK